MEHPTLPAPWSRRFAEQRLQREFMGRQRHVTHPQGHDFSSNDYLGLRHDPRLTEAAHQAALSCGSGMGAARLLRGTSPFHEALEAELAQWKGLPACLLFNSGFQANATLLPALLNPGDGVFSDQFNHASLVDGCRMARLKGATVEVYRHGDVEDLQKRLQAWQRPPGGQALVVTDAVFSMDGDCADLAALVTLCEQHEALLLVDEAHATGLMGDTGAGLTEAQGVKGRIPLVMGTLGKALGSFGAFIACPDPIRDHLVNTCRGFIFSTALPAPVVAASLAACRIARQEPWRRVKALAYAQQLRDALHLERASSAIVPVVLGEDRAALAEAERLQGLGFDVRAVRPPTVPEGTARLRITTGAHLASEVVDGLISALKASP